jgi:streptogramin lyase
MKEKAMRIAARLRGSKAALLLLGAALFLFVVVSGSALAVETTDHSGTLLPTNSEIAEAIAAGSENGDTDLTEPAAAEGVPLQDLERAEALALLIGVFGTPVEAAAGIYDELQGATLLSSHVAVLPEDGPSMMEEPHAENASSQVASELGRDESSEALPEAEARAAEGPPAEVPAEVAGANLADSTIPFEVGAGGEVMDLGLIRQEGHLEPAAPLVQSQIPGDLSEEIELPEAGIGIELAGLSDQRSASVSEGSVAFYPNVAQDSDLAVSPTPTGVETMTQLRSPASPDSQTYHLSLPRGATLSATAIGGAEVKSDDEVLLTVPAPVAIDAKGEALPVELTVNGEANTVKVAVEPEEADSYPILVDPLFQSYEWAAKNTRTGICSNSFQQESFYSCNNREEWGYEVFTHYGLSPAHMQAGNHEFSVASAPGIAVKAELAQTAGDHADVLYTVPRYFTESPAPTSYIKSLKLSGMDWRAYGQYGSPSLFMGIWDSSNPHWVSSYTHTGQVEHGVHEPAFVYEFTNSDPTTHEPDTHAKAAEVTIRATESTSQSNAEVYVGAATVELGDTESPSGPVTSVQNQWGNQTASPLSFTASDTGLGVYAVSAATEEVDSKGKPLHTWTAKYGCIGVGDSACPRTWNSSESGHPALTYEPSLLPSGIDYLAVFAEDPLGNRSSTSWTQVRVDHIAPTTPALTGTMTEQDALGTRRASYTLKATASDGNAEHPQSGVATAEVKLDGKKVAMEGKQAEQWSPKCATQNCSLSAEWALDTSALAEGKHTIEVLVTDAAGNVSAPKVLTIETRPASAPTLSLSGSVTEQATLGTSRPRYALKAKSSAMAAGFEAPTLGAAPAYAGSIGGFRGEGTGRFYEPADVAVDSHGNVWAIDGQTRTANQLQDFNEKGEWVRSTGSSGYGKLSGPRGVAADSSGNVWVADTGNNRVVEFNEKGEFVKTFGTNVNKTKVEAGATEAEKNLCTAASGNVCQAATAGSLEGQLKSPKGIALTAGGNVWVVDTGNNRVEKFTPSGGLLNRVSGEGSEPGKLKEPSAITVAPDGSIWVVDTGNRRIEQWNSSAAFVRAVGKEGTGDGEFRLPTGIEADSTGAIWVSEVRGGKVQEFDETGVFLRKFLDENGSEGAALGITTDGRGSIWIGDPTSALLYHWTIPGFPVYSSSVGSSGSGNGQFMHLAALASDGNKGHIWALDQELGRLQEFNEKGEWLRNAGSVGSGAGMLSSPSGLSANNLGNVWVADTGNNRIVEFNEKGEFVETFGTNVNKTKVEAGGTEAEKNLCTAASGNVCQTATAGSSAGQLKAPRGIAVTSGGNIWVADTGNSRIEKFTPGGVLLNNLSGEGTEPGKLKEPAAIAVAPDGSIWVADTGNNRIQQWNSSMVLLHTIGKEGGGGGEFKSPAAIFADAPGNIWVGDQKNNRVEEFGEGGRYRGQFGASGSGTFSLSAPMGIAVDNGGSIWVADPGHAKIQRWGQEVPRSEVTTTLWIDGNQQTGLHGTCKTAGCTIEPQWTIESAALEAKSHVARVKTTDGLGRSAESTVNFSIARDTTKPTLEVSGELFNAPEGWVEQETYGLNATATDSGYGVTSISFKIDGQQVASASQTCLDGGCKESLSKQISMASYSGGSHPAEVIATDGAGNSLVKKWTINVDPEGRISTAELTATLEAVEETSPATIVGEARAEPAIEGSAAGLGAEEWKGQIITTGTAVPVEVAPATNDGFTLAAQEFGAFMATCSNLPPQPEDAPVQMETCQPAPPGVGNGPGVFPIEVTPASTDTTDPAFTLIDKTAAVAHDTAPETDTAIRPLYEGVLTFANIRDKSSPEAFTWKVQLAEGMYLHAAGAQGIEARYANGHPAFTIVAEPASDAVGTTVPTDLTVDSTDELTLHVHHRSSSYVYPVVAGAGWQGGYFSEEVHGPLDEKELREARERAEAEAREQAELANVPLNEEFTRELIRRDTNLIVKVSGASAPLWAAQSGTEVPPHFFEFSQCWYENSLPPMFSYEPYPIAPRETETMEKSLVGSCVLKNTDHELLAAVAIGGYFRYQAGQGVWYKAGDPFECSKIGPYQPAKVNCGIQPKSSTTSITARGDYKFPQSKAIDIVGPLCDTVYGHLNASRPHKEVMPEILEQRWEHQSCNWPSWPH